MTCLPKVLITGANGQLASAFREASFSQDYEICFCSRAELDITNVALLKSQIAQIKPHYIINTAAYTQVDNAEHEKEMALNINVNGVNNLTIICEQFGIKLVHLSTDYVFDGKKNSPYDEHDTAGPINFYGHSKYLGEQLVRPIDRHLILRVSAIFGEHGHNFLKTILQLAARRKELRIVSDQMTCPTYATDIANIIFALIEKNASGLYHFCSATAVSWYDFANEILRIAKLENKIIPVRSNEYASAAKRPLYSVLGCNKIKNNFALQQPCWQNGIARALHHLGK